MTIASLPFKPACFALILAWLPQSLIAANYIQPDESKEIFKLEKVPLQVDSMRELANHLIILARRKHDSSAADQRATAQMLALAMRLDPANQDARETNQALQASKHILPSPDHKISSAKARLRFYQRWLGSSDAGKDANLLAHYITDATKTLNPQTTDNDDLGDWAGVVPPLEKYNQPTTGDKELPRPPKKDDSPTPDEPEENTPKRDTPPADTGNKADFHIKELSVSAPFALQTTHSSRDPKEPDKKIYRTRHFNQITSIKLTLSPCSERERQRLHIKQIEGDERLRKSVAEGIERTLSRLLESRHSKLSPYRCMVTIADGGYSPSNGGNLATSIALMLEASLANAPLRQNIHVCATIDEKGKLTHPGNFWEMLATMRQSKSGGRLIISPESAQLMPQVLVFGEPDFFTRWEVFEADTLDNALALATRKSDDKLTEASRLFETVQNLARRTDVTKIAVNRAVRTRLQNIVSLAPNHVSSKTLLIQGGGKRPMRLSKKALAHETLPVVRNMRSALISKDINVDRLSATRLKTIHDQARESLDKIERLVDHTNDDLYQETLQLANDFRRLMILARRIADDHEARNSHEGKKARELYYEMIRQSGALLNKTLDAAGYPTEDKDKD